MGFLDKLSSKQKGVLLAVLAVVGILLVIFGMFSEKKSEDESLQKNISEKSETLEYITRLENKISNITEQITGSDDVKVIVSVSSGTEYVYVSNESAAGDKNTREYITVKNESGRYELVLAKEVYPEIKGISIACPGGDSSAVQRKIINSISTAFGISKNRICIVGTK